MHILTICGSLRRDSYNRKLMTAAAAELVRLGSTVAEADISGIPLYSGDLEGDSWPPAAKAFFDAVAAADAALIVSPEYNYSIPGGLKNALDWASVGENAWKNKPVAVMGVSSHQYGTARGQMHLRQALLGTGPVWVVPHPQVCVPFGAEAFDDSGSLRDPKMGERMRGLCANLIALAERLKG